MSAHGSGLEQRWRFAPAATKPDDAIDNLSTAPYRKDSP